MYIIVPYRRLFVQDHNIYPTYDKAQESLSLWESIYPQWAPFLIYQLVEPVL